MVQVRILAAERHGGTTRRRWTGHYHAPVPPATGRTHIATAVPAWFLLPGLGVFLKSATRAVSGTWLTIDLGTAITANGTYTLVVRGRSSDAAWFASRETSHDPQLIVFR